MANYFERTHTHPSNGNTTLRVNIKLTPEDRELIEEVMLDPSREAAREWVGRQIRFLLNEMAGRPTP